MVFPCLGQSDLVCPFPTPFVGKVGNGLVREAMPKHILSVKKLEAIKTPGRYSDGGGLYLVVGEGEARSWIMRIMQRGNPPTLLRRTGYGPCRSSGTRPNSRATPGASVDNRRLTSLGPALAVPIVPQENCQFCYNLPEVRGHSWTRLALLHKSSDDRGYPFPGRTYPTASVTGMPSAVKPFRTATRTWNSAT